MKKSIKIETKVMMASLCLAAATCLGQTQDPPVGGQPVGPDQTPVGPARVNQTRTYDDKQVTTDHRYNDRNDRIDRGDRIDRKDRIDRTGGEGQVMKMNKCSQLIGTAVENPQGDKLGKVDDVVVDLDNGKVSYCVMSVEHSLFASPKYIALPLSALQPNGDGTRLILNADKEKVAQAEGFDKNNWPSVTTPSWGAQPFWQANPRVRINTPDRDRDRTIPSDTTH